MPDQKYVVFKVDEWDKWARGESGEDTPNPITDCVVIRFQDIFAAPGLYAYANNIQTLIEGFSRLDNPDHSEAWHEALQAQIARLEDLRDIFHEFAVTAEETPFKKIPD